MASERALLLIADIGGYTEYMRTHRMSLAHAEVNTARLLEAIIGAADGFDLIEIEGDAAFLSLQVDTLDGIPAGFIDTNGEVMLDAADLRRLAAACLNAADELDRLVTTNLG